MRACGAVAVGLTLAGCSLGASACGSGGGSARPDPRRWLSVDASARRATVTLVAAYDATASGFNIDGANKGALLFSVPSGWALTVRCVNNSSARRYACALAHSPGTPMAVVPPTARTQTELAPGSQAAFSLTVGAPPTRYRLVALTGGSEPAGMWVTLEVVRGGLPRVRWVR